MLEPQFAVQRPLQIIAQQGPGFIGLPFDNRFGQQPVQGCRIAHHTAHQLALCVGLGIDGGQGTVLAGVNRLEGTVGSLQISWQETVKVADDNQRHVVGRVPLLAYSL